MLLESGTAHPVLHPHQCSLDRARVERPTFAGRARALLLLLTLFCACGKEPAPSAEGNAQGGASLGSSGTTGSAGQATGGEGELPGGGAGVAGSATQSAGGSAGSNLGGGGSSAAGGSAGASGGRSGLGGASGQGGNGAQAGNAAQAGSDGAAELIHYYGRWNLVTGAAIAVNGGSHVRTQFSGTGVSARFDVSLNQVPNPTLVWRIDQGAWQEGELAAKLVLATGLAAGKHDLFLMIRGLNEYQNRWAPPLISAITLLGIDVTGGALAATPRPVGPRLEFVGDSITEGVAVWPDRTGKDTACWRADGRLGYAAQTALTLGADWRQVGFGGEGILKPGNGGVPVFNDSFNWIYQGVPRDAWQPELVILNVGTVDRADVGPDFAPAFTKFLGTVRAGYAGAKIAALRPFGGYHGAEVKAAVAARTAAGDTRLYYIDTTGWLSAADYTDGIHPNVQGSAKVALALSAELKRIGLL